MRLPCPTGDNASLGSLTVDKFPGALDTHYSFVSGLHAVVSPSLAGTMTVGFVIPSGQQAAAFSILHWDGAQWVDLGGTQSGGLIVVDTTLTGDFILVTG